MLLQHPLFIPIPHSKRNALSSSVSGASSSVSNLNFTTIRILLFTVSIALFIANVAHATPNIALNEQNTLLNNEIPKTYATSTVEAILRYNAELDVLEGLDISSNIYCSCVKTARSEGLKLPIGDAEYLQPNSMPVEGGGILLKYGNVYHVAKILNFTPSGFFIVEGNFKLCKKTYRVILYNDKSIRGFWSPVPSS